MTSSTSLISVLQNLGSISAPDGTFPVTHGNEFVVRGAREYVNITSYGAKVDSVTDDTDAWMAAIEDVGKTNQAVTIWVPNTGKESLVSDTIRIYGSGDHPIEGLVIKGDGGVPDGAHGMTSSITWNGSTIRGTSGCTVKKYTFGLRLQGLKGLLGVAHVGDIIETWKSRNPRNNGRWPILEITSDTECVVWNPDGVEGETNMCWLLERFLMDLRVTGPTLTNLSFYARGNTNLTGYLKWTESPLAGVQPPTGIRLRDIALINDNVEIVGKYPIVRWGYVIGSQIVPQPGHPEYAVDPDGFPVSIWPSNCDLGIYEHLLTGYLEQGGVFWDSGNGNDYAHAFYSCAFINQPMGAYIVAPLRGQGNFYECGGGGIWDTVIQIGCSTLRTNIHGGHSEVCGTLFSASDGMTVTNHTSFLGGTEGNGWVKEFYGVGHPVGLAPTGDVISAGNSLIVDGCDFDGGPAIGTGQHCSVSSTPHNMAQISIRGTVWGVNDYQKGKTSGVLPFILTTSKKAPWGLEDGQTLTFTVKVNGVSSSRTMTFHASDFRDINRCWPWEVAYAFQKDPAFSGVTPWFRGDGTGLVFILQNPNPRSSDQIVFTGGTAATELGLDDQTYFSNLFVFNTTPPEVTASNGTVVCRNATPLHLVLSANSIYDKFVDRHFPVPESDLYFRTNTSFTDYAPPIRMLTPGPSMGSQACRNLGGTLKFHGNTARVLFALNEINPDYQILFTGLCGSYWVNSQSRKGFQVTVSELPSQTASWMIYRPEASSGVDPVVFPTIPDPVFWMDAGYDAHLEEASSVASDNFPDSLRPRLVSVKEQVSGQLLQVKPGLNNCFRIDRDDQISTSKTPNGWPYLHSCFNTKIGGLSLPPAKLFTSDAWTIIMVSAIPVANAVTICQPVTAFNLNGVDFQYNASAGSLGRSIGYVGVTSFNDTVGDAVPGKWEIVEVAKSPNKPPTMTVNGVARTLSNASYTTFSPTDAIQLGADGGLYNVAFLAAWASDVSGSLGTLRASINARFGLY